MAEFRLSNFTSGVALTAAELNTGLTFTDYTPTWTQSVAITKTVNWARYTRFGKLVIGSVKMTATSAGTADNKILVGLPVNASSNNQIMGTMYLYDASPATSKFRFPVVSVLYDSASAVAFSPRNSVATILDGADTDARFGQNYNSGGASATGFTIGSGDIIYIQFQYEAA